MLRSGRVTAMDESRIFCVRLVEPAMFMPMLWMVCEKLTELALMLWV